MFYFYNDVSNKDILLAKEGSLEILNDDQARLKTGF